MISSGGKDELFQNLLVLGLAEVLLKILICICFTENDGGGGNLSQKMLDIKWAHFHPKILKGGSHFGRFHGNGRTFRDSFSTFKHSYHKDLVCENKSNVIIV